ncbi:MAG: hypothetical protein M1500_03415 [Candidatus Marsarchaeota archaeon]|nr:hypothetical protein [Candidatus Marsarchaeota archaeon]MCL5112729.1 hypothetical protein [Candidatus Marsarchaeota archaeon]
MAYIMIEGPDGSGKTESASRLLASLKDAGYDAIAVREPGNGTLGTLVRSTLSGISAGNYNDMKSYFQDGSGTERLLDRIAGKACDVIDAQERNALTSNYAAIKGLLRSDGVLDRLLNALTTAKEIDIESLQLLFTAVRSEDMKRLSPFLAKKDTVVISDRGYPSTITYAESGGPNAEYVEFLKLINSRFPRPNLMFVLSAQPDILFKRIQVRGGRERFDSPETIRNLIESYKRNYPDAVYIDASQSREKVHEEIMGHVISLLRKLEVRPINLQKK